MLLMRIFMLLVLDCLIVAYVTQRDRYEWWNLAQVPLGCLHLEPGYPRGRVVANAGTHDTLAIFDGFCVENAIICVVKHYYNSMIYEMKVALPSHLDC